MGIGLLILWDAKLRFFISIAGIAMAISIIFVEQGFFYGVLDSQARIATMINGSLVIMHQQRTHLNKWNSFKKIHCFRAATVNGVEKVIPIYKGFISLRNKETDWIKRILVYAFPPDTFPLLIGDPTVVLTPLREAKAVMFDRLSRDIYGRIEAGDDMELDGMTYRLRGFVDIGPDVLNDGTMLMGDGAWLRHHPQASPLMAVIQLAKDADPNVVRNKLADMLPELSVLTPLELAEREKIFTGTSVPIGIVFGIGMFAGLIIGLVICYQVLFNEINDLKSQYATLIAMGFSGRFLGGLVIEQALILCFAGFLLAVPVVLLIFYVLEQQTALVFALDFQRSLRIFGMSILMCLGASIFAVRSVLRTDPAELY